jgi:hypothetical protein
MTGTDEGSDENDEPLSLSLLVFEAGEAVVELSPYALVKLGG